MASSHSARLLCWAEPGCLTLTTLNTSAQLSLPNHMRARGMGCYMTAIALSMSCGGLLWGQVAGWLGLSMTQWIAAGTLLVTAATSRCFSVGRGSGSDRARVGTRRRTNGVKALGNLLSAWCPKIEEPEDLVSRQSTAGGWRARLGEQCVEHFSFLIQDSSDSLFDCVHRQHSCDRDCTFGSDSMSPIDRLVLNGWVPPAIKQKNVLTELKDSNPHCLHRSSLGSRCSQDHS